MTKIECMQKMIKIWRYLQKHPETCFKTTAYSELGLSKDLHDCPCCEYAFQFIEENRQYCIYCPLFDFWECDGTSLSAFCEATDTRYHRWYSGNSAERQMAAKEIADYSEQLLQKL